MISKYVPRMADSVVEQMLKRHSAVMVTGPRATGKTTSAARLAKTRIDLTNPGTTAVMRSDAVSYLKSLPRPVLIDEWQMIPSVLTAVKTLVDEDSTQGQFIITGSIRGNMTAPMWPGTGRILQVQMFGLTEREIELAPSPSWLSNVLAGEIVECQTSETLVDYIERALRSGFPEPALNLSPIGRIEWLYSYVHQIINRDAAEMENRDSRKLGLYLRAWAMHSAGIINDATLYAAAGIAKDTARAYERLLTNLLIIDQLPAWSTIRLHELTLAPKRFLVDPGLITGILRVTQDDVLRDSDLLGRVLETFVVSQIRAELALAVPPPEIHHLRTAKGQHEIDLVIEIGYQKFVAIEVKSTSAPKSNDIKHLRWFQEKVGDQCVAAIVLHTGPATFPMGNGIMACPIASLWST